MSFPPTGLDNLSDNKHTDFTFHYTKLCKAGGFPPSLNFTKAMSK